MPEFVSSVVANRFAHALDADDFPEAARLLEEHCLYQLNGEEIRGQERVIRSFTLASQAHSNLDQVTYELRVPPSNYLEALCADREGQYSIRINDQFRICFRWTDEGPIDIKITDYH